MYFADSLVSIIDTSQFVCMIVSITEIVCKRSPIMIMRDSFLVCFIVYSLTLFLKKLCEAADCNKLRTNNYVLKNTQEHVILNAVSVCYIIVSICSAFSAPVDDL